MSVGDASSHSSGASANASGGRINVAQSIGGQANPAQPTTINDSYQSNPTTTVSVTPESLTANPVTNGLLPQVSGSNCHTSGDMVNFGYGDQTAQFSAPGWNLPQQSYGNLGNADAFSQLYNSFQNPGYYSGSYDTNQYAGQNAYANPFGGQGQIYSQNQLGPEMANLMGMLGQISGAAGGYGNMGGYGMGQFDPFNQGYNPQYFNSGTGSFNSPYNMTSQYQTAFPLASAMTGGMAHQGNGDPLINNNNIVVPEPKQEVNVTVHNQNIIDS